MSLAIVDSCRSTLTSTCYKLWEMTVASEIVVGESPITNVHKDVNDVDDFPASWHHFRRGTSGL